IYPVITLEPPYDHTSSRKQLIGAHPSARQSAEWSVQTHVRRSDPAMFLVQAADDPISNPANSAIMEEACQQADVPVVRHLLPSGGHGFGMGRAAGPTRLWPGWYEDWLRGRGML
ncbi:alpha/beta hydrolase, partial [Thioclava sp. BHET1]